MIYKIMICPYCKQEDECHEHGPGVWVCDDCFNEQEPDEDDEDDE